MLMGNEESLDAQEVLIDEQQRRGLDIADMERELSVLEAELKDLHTDAGEAVGADVVGADVGH